MKPFPLLAWGMAVASCAFAGTSDEALAQHLVAKAGRKGGICSLPRCGDGQLAMAVAKGSGFLIHAQDARPAMVEAARRAADAVGLLGKRIYAEQGRLDRIPFADSYVDLLVLADLDDELLREISAPEILRALCPNGRAILGRSRHARGGALTRSALAEWLKAAGMDHAVVSEDGFGLWAELTKPPLQGTDDWPHWFHDADNNPVSTDSILRWPYLTQWLAKPYYGTQPRTTVVAAGRLFSAAGSCRPWSAPSGQMATALLLTACNAYNGQILWQRKLPDHYRVGRSAFVATETTLYLIAGASVLCLDALTGEERRRIRFDGVKGHPKWIALDDGTLFCLAGKEDLPVDRAKLGHVLVGSYPVPPVGKNHRRHWGFGTEIAAYDLEANRTLWHHVERAGIDGRTIGVCAGKLFFYAAESRVGCLDIRSGKLVWANEGPEVVEALRKTGPFGHAALQSTRPGMLCTPEVVLINTKGKANLVALSARDGAVLWQKGVRGGVAHPLWLEGKVYERREGILGPLTGESKGKFNCVGAGCGPVTASPYGFYGRHGIGYDRARDKPVSDHSFRSGCWQNGIPANGLLFCTPYLCQCNYSLRGFVVLGPAGAFEFGREATEGERLEAAARLAPASFPAVSELDWPTYRGSNQRTGASRASLPERAAQLWAFEPQVPFEPTAPIAAGGCVFVCGDDGKVLCLDGTTGELRWQFVTAGRAFFPPTIWQGRAYVGSSDGWVYALEAATGRMLWRFRAAPIERRIMVYGHLSSTWPVNSGVLVADGVAYAAAGLIDRDGTHVYALDARTGRLKWQNNTSGHIDGDNHKGASVQGCLAIARGRLWMASGNAISPVAYDLATGKAILPEFASRSAYVPVRRGREIGVFRDRFIVRGGQLLFGNQFERNRRSGSRNDHFAFSKLDEKGSVLYPEIIPAPSCIPPAWDQQAILFARDGFGKLECWDAEKTAAHIDALHQKHRDATGGRPRKLPFVVGPNNVDRKTLVKHPMTAWGPFGGDLFGLVLARNAAVVTHGKRPKYNQDYSEWWIAALDRKDGTTLWEIKLPSAPLLHGLCIDRNGHAIVALANGRILCFGKQE